MKVIKHKDKWYLQSETGYKEILLSTDDLLIQDGVQAIDDEFLEWFVKNPSCEEIEAKEFWFSLDKSTNGNLGITSNGYWGYKIKIPKEESKQSTKNRIFSETSKEIKQKAKDYGNSLVNKEEQKQHLINIMKVDEELGLYEEPKQTDEKGKPITYWGGLEKHKQETLEHTSKFIVFTLQDSEDWVQYSIALDSFEKADNFCQQFRDKKMSYLICQTLKQGYNGK